MIDFKEYIIKHQKKIQQEKDKVLLLWKMTIHSQTSALEKVSKQLFESNLGGKNIRGALVCLGYELYAKNKSLDMYTLAAAYELLHTSLLIQDDVIDKSILRRGKQTVFQRLGGDHYGISQAICLGDSGFFIATKMINEMSAPNRIKTTIISQLSQIILDTITGQMLDIEFSNKSSEATEKDVIKISQLKTAQYTITGPLLVGAILGGANEKSLKQLSLFGEKLGIAFQIKDDLLGVFGDEAALGKSIQSDIEEGKNTLLIVHALSQATKKQKSILDKYYGKGKSSERTLRLIKQIFQETGALEYSEKKIQKYTHQASLLLSEITTQKSLHSLLENFINYLIKRDR